MPDILRAIDSESAAQSPLTNLYDFFRYMAMRLGPDGREDDGIVHWHAPLMHPWFRGVLSGRSARDGDGVVIDEQIEYFESKGVPGFSWWLESKSKADRWGELFSARGFSLDSGTPGMAINLDALPAERALPANTRIEAVADDATLRIWATTCGEGFGFGGDPGDGLLRTMQALGLELPVRSYLAYLDDEPVATSTLYLGAGVAGLYNVATTEAARGRGIGAALTLAPLHDSRDEGYGVGILHASDMGYPIYKRLGFATTCKVENYYYSFDSFDA